MKVIYRSKGTDLNKLPRNSKVIYQEDWLMAAGFGFALSVVALTTVAVLTGEALGVPQHTWSVGFKSGLLYAEFGVSVVTGYLATKLLTPKKAAQQTRGAVLHEDHMVGGDGFQALKAFLDEEYESQPGKSAPLALLAPRGVNIHKVVPGTASQQHTGLLSRLFRKKNPFDRCAPLSDDRSRTHMLFVGGTGTGKSLSMKAFLHQAIAAGHKVVILDKKGEYTEEIASQRVALFGLHDKRQLRWAVCRDIRTIPDAQQFLEGLIPVDAGQPYWGTSARLVGTAMFAHLLSSKPGAWDLQDLNDLCVLPVEELAKFALDAYPQVTKILEGEGQSLNSVLGNLAAFIAPLITFTQEWTNSDYQDFSFSDWLDDPDPIKNCLVFQSGGRYNVINDPLIRGCVTFMASYIDSPMYERDSKESPRSLWFFCDEFQSFGKLETFTKVLLERGRDKGARIVIGAQDISQLNELYNEHFVKFLMSNIGITALAGANQGDTAEMFSKNIGQLSFLKTHVTHSESGKSTNDQEHNEDVITTSEIIGKLGFKEGCTRVLYRMTRSPDAYIVHQPLIAYPRINKANVPADWTLGIPKLVKPKAAAEVIDMVSKSPAQTTAAKSQEVQYLSEELPEELDEIPEGYEDSVTEEENQEHQTQDFDEMASPVASVIGVSGIEHALTLIELLGGQRPKLKNAKSIRQVRKEISQSIL